VDVFAEQEGPVLEGQAGQAARSGQRVVGGRRGQQAPVGLEGDLVLGPGDRRRRRGGPPPSGQERFGPGQGPILGRLREGEDPAAGAVGEPGGVDVIRARGQRITKAFLDDGRVRTGGPRPNRRARAGRRPPAARRAGRWSRRARRGSSTSSSAAGLGRPDAAEDRRRARALTVDRIHGPYETSRAAVLYASYARPERPSSRRRLPRAPRAESPRPAAARGDRRDGLRQRPGEAEVEHLHVAPAVTITFDGFRSR